MSQVLRHKIITVKELLGLSLTIPEYQRPYKWTSRHITQLFEDIDVHKEKSAYRLGTIVFHQNKEQQNVLNIVDGQQRTLTLILAVKAIIDIRLAEIVRQDLKNTLTELQKPLDDFMARTKFANNISQHNLHQNYVDLKRLVSRKEDFTETHIDFLINKCEVVTFYLEDISEAFQFFDAQNARGRDLDPHDLLKAFHLREFSEAEIALKGASVVYWEDQKSEALTELFEKYLYRIRQWARGHSARYFTKSDVHLFKGVNLDRVGNYPYVAALRISHHYVDDYNQQYQRKIDAQHMVFPFHLDQQIINGRRFFEMTTHYHGQVKKIVQGEHNTPAHLGNIMLSELAKQILKTLNTYDARDRTGDQYVRCMFDCALIYYIDKFGYADISRAIEKTFIWAYSLRLTQYSIQLATMDNHVQKNNIFVVIKEATQPSDYLSIELATVKADSNITNIDKVNSVVELFKTMKYYESNQ